MATLLVIEDELVLAKNIARFFEKEGHLVEVAHDGLAGVQAAARVQPDVVIVDFQMPGMDGLEVIRSLRTQDDPPRIIMVTGHASVHLAVEAMKAGSMDLLTKPITLQNLKEVVNRAIAEKTAHRALDYYRQRDARRAGLEALVGRSAAMEDLRQLVRTIASIEPTDQSPAAPVLILGETGTGKDLVARACHQCGARAQHPFIEVNCAALPAHLMEGELFGFEKGAFTDAHARKIGLIEAADGGTLFLDEIGELDMALQAKLLRVLENLRVRRLGALADRQVNVRILAATNRDLQDQVSAGKFRADLMYRLQVLQVQIAPLRERPEDIPDLAAHLLAQLARRYGRSDLSIDDAALAALSRHPWPGNVRELRNVLERAFMLQRNGCLTEQSLQLVSPQRDSAPVAITAATAPSTKSLDAVESEHLQRALLATGGNVSKAAALLGISRDTMRYRMERHGLAR